MTATKARNAAKPQAPDGALVYAVGDIHGQLRLLDRLLEEIEADAARSDAERRVLVFIGDYVDRGPDSARVIERLVSGLPDGYEARFLMGNHEDILLQVLDNPGVLELWLVNGGAATLASYGVEAPGPGSGVRAFTMCRDAFARALPPTHLAFFERLEFMVTLGDYVFVHAGIRPGTPLEKQVQRDLLWIRHDFLYSEEDFGVVVVHGHTPGPLPVERPNRIGIDTGAVVYGRLTALRLEGASRAFLTVGE